MSNSSEKKSSLGERQSFDHGEVINHVTSNRIFQQPTHVPHLDNIAMANEREASRLLKEAQANLEFSADTGYAPELRRNFSMLALIGVGFGITNSWAGISGSLITGIASGGPMMIVYGIVIVCAFSSCIVVTLSELASAYPNASGQIYWTMKLAPRRYSRLLAYITGVLSWVGSVFTSASITITVSVAILGMYALFRPEFVVHKWQVFIVYEIFNVFMSFFSVYDRPLPAIFSGTLVISLASFIIVIITVLAMHKGDFQSAKFVFVEFNNQTGWSSAGIAFIVGLINPNWSFNGLDAATHIAEESLNPAIDIPKALISTIIIGFVTTFAYCIAIFFCIRNLDAVLASNTGIPILDILHQATGSKGAAIGLGILLVITSFGCTIGCHTWSARICWGFARDNGLPFSKYWSQVNTNTGTTVNAHYLSCFWVGVIGCIYLGSDTAFNSILVCSVIWSFSFYEESYDETYQSEDNEEDTEDNSRTSILPEENAPNVLENGHEFPKSVYNPFLLTKMNYFRRKSSKVKLRVFDKKVVVAKSKVVKNVHSADGKDRDVLFWQSTARWNGRKGCPTEHLLSVFATKVGCKTDKIILVKEHGNSWYTMGV
ncbi:hypothetical protein CANMA_004718 [Candida margitis]|uniref:uncharacterized protein n=1 Tax=Candida margitis TaxID=1775924 RepID=UPI002225E6CD|nr:uncharacterized protein CANMA_004718 [Candida margitis]KAI5953879.1 hypothetical protein CANMA_004718 [Candida margitis]